MATPTDPSASHADPDAATDAASPTDQDLTGTDRHHPAMIAYWDSAGLNKFSTSSYRDRYDLTIDTILDLNVGDLAGPEATDEGMPHVHAALAGQSQMFERTTVDPFGAVRYTEGTYTPYLIAGVVQGFFSVVVDTTDKVVEAAALLARLESVVLRRERERLAADLHDTVAQRLFGVSMSLSIALGLDPAVTTDLLHSAMDSLDSAIVELRSAISRLTARLTPVEVATAVAVMAREAAGQLGFVPTVTYMGLLDLAPEVSGELLATLTEAISNVAQHADATQVDITITANHGHIVLEVVDDGRGIGRLDRVSGLANMRARAENLGGTFGWSANPTGGTILRWQAPSDGNPLPSAA